MGYRNLDSQKSEMAGMQPEDRRRTERRLGRGLEDVSYLFLSQAVSAPSEKPQEQNILHEPILTERTQPGNPFVLHASPAVNQEMLISLLRENTYILEEGMRTIDTNIPCDQFGTFDLLALDGLDQLVVIDVDTAQNDDLLLRGIGHFDWVVHNLDLLRRMYRGSLINCSDHPRLFLVASDFSVLLKCAVRCSVRPQIFCFKYRAVSVSGDVGVFFERA
jgi:hypothetical protein